MAKRLQVKHRYIRGERLPVGWDIPGCDCGGLICPSESGAKVQAAFCTCCQKEYVLEFLVQEDIGPDPPHHVVKGRRGI